MKVIIPLAGKGTRLRPHTHLTPKPMLKVAGKPVMAYVLDELKKLGNVDQDVLQIFFPVAGFSAEFVLRHADDLAVAGEYALGRPLRKVDVLTAG